MISAKVHLRVFLLYFIVGILSSSLCRASDGDYPVVMAHYMPWFKAEPLPSGQIDWAHWQWFGKGTKHDPDDFREDGRRDIASVYTPLIGAYNGQDPDVLLYHCLTARSAGIKGFIANWYGQNTYTDHVFGLLMDQLERTGMLGAICLEEKSWFPPYTQAETREQAMEEARKQIDYVLKTHAVRDAYWKWNDRPVLFVFNGYEEGALGKNSFTPEELQEVLSAFKESDPFYIRGEIHPEYLPAADTFYSWVGGADYRTWYYKTANALKNEGQIPAVIGSASPGFDDSGVHGWGGGVRTTPRREGREYRESWEDTIHGNPDVVQLVTWNDFQEGSTIEPADEYGFEYIDYTEEYIGRFTDRRPQLNDNPWGYRLYRLQEASKGQKKIEAQVGDLESRIIKGQRFLIPWRLGRLEKKIGIENVF